MTDEPPRAADLPAGYDDADPYVDIDLENLPTWWRENVKLFEKHGLRPYRPARLADGEPLPIVLQDLEERYDVSISVQTAAPQESNDWEVRVDGEQAAFVTKTRTKQGRSSYEIDSSALERIIAESVDDKRSTTETERATGDHE